MFRRYSVLLIICSLTTAQLVGCAASASGTRAGIDLANPDRQQVQWVEDTPAPPPAYDMNRLIDIAMPPGFNVKMGIDPNTITVNFKTGVVRYVTVARGTSAINAMYEGIRCSTGEFRVYARQVKGQPWQPTTDSTWRNMNDPSGVMFRHPAVLAQSGVCDGPTITRNALQIGQALGSNLVDGHRR